MNKLLSRRLKYATRKLAPQPAAGIVRMLNERLRGCKTKAEVEAKKLELLLELIRDSLGSGISREERKNYMKLVAHLVDMWALLSLITRLRPRFICLRLIPTHLRLPAPRVEVLQPLAGRAPPVAEIFIPIPKTEQGSCARSDLADSAYLIEVERFSMSIC
jgi:hypothetical protein